MKLASIVRDGRTEPAVVVDEQVIPVAGMRGIPDSLDEVASDPDRWLPWLAGYLGTPRPAASAR